MKIIKSDETIEEEKRDLIIKKIRDMGYKVKIIDKQEKMVRKQYNKIWELLKSYVR